MEVTCLAFKKHVLGMVLVVYCRVGLGVAEPVMQDLEVFFVAEKLFVDVSYHFGQLVFRIIN